MTLRRRLVLATMFVGGASLLGLNVAVFRFVSKNLYDRLDEQVRAASDRFGAQRPLPLRSDGRIDFGALERSDTGSAAFVTGEGAASRAGIRSRAAGDDPGSAASPTSTAPSASSTSTPRALPGSGRYVAPDQSEPSSASAVTKPLGAFAGAEADALGRSRPPRPRRLLPNSEIYTEVRAADGTRIGDPRIVSLDETSVLELELPDPLPKPTPAGTTFSVHATGGSNSRYRVAYTSVVRGGGERVNVLTALPADDLEATLERLRTIQSVAALAVLLAIATGSWLAVHFSLRPLREIEEAAATIAAGDLSHRIRDEDPSTEIGRLGQSLNSMMTRIEDAFRTKAESEAQLQRFLADASHELRTPLTAVRGYAQFHRRARAGKDSETDHAMARIEDASTRMARIVEDLLSIARQQQGAPMRLDPLLLDGLVGAIVDDARASHPERSVNVSSRPVSVRADAERLHRAIANVVDNALRHTPGSAVVNVVVDADHTSGEATVVVSDDGPGIAEEHLAHLFEPFYRADPGRSRHTGGSGLGLAIAAATLESHGGRITVESTIGTGTCFHIALPLLDAPVNGEEHPAMVGSPATGVGGVASVHETGDAEAAAARAPLGRARPAPDPGPTVGSALHP